jgi:YD repeat-containing protein
VSTTSYDLLGRPVRTDDGKGVQTRTYDPVTGELTSVDDSAAGTFTGTYDSGGRLVEQGLPNGMTATTTYDAAGSPVSITYVKTTNCVFNCRWVEQAVTESIHGQWLSSESTLSKQKFSYDGAGRLTKVHDTPAGQGCAIRSYGYDADSNRTSQTTRTPGSGGACDATATGQTQAHSF